MDESDVRRLIKRAMGKDVEWVEPGWGSTVGLADCNLSFGGESVPVELKFWKYTKFGLKAEMRPAQRRYHIMNAKKGKRSAILFGVEVKGSAGEFMLHLIPNHLCPLENYSLKKRNCWTVGSSVGLEKDLKLRLWDFLFGDRSEEFWTSK